MAIFKVQFPNSLVLIYIKYNSFKTNETNTSKLCNESNEIFIVTPYVLPDVMNGVINFNFCLN